MLKSFLFKITDSRRGQGKCYKQGHILLFSIFAMLCGADSYRKIASFIEYKYPLLNRKFNLNWKKIPAYTTIRNIIKSVSSEELEKTFREYNLELLDKGKKLENRVIAFDGKVLRGSFDNFKDKGALQVLSAFLTEEKIILAHKDIPDKTSEIAAVIELMDELKIKNYTFTADALHCQKKL